jgi:hypothetical protein
MLQSPQAEAYSAKSGMRAGFDLQRRFWLALGMYAVLAAIIWFTMDAGKVDLFGKPVELRLVPLIIIGGLALRTVLAVKADKIRHDVDVTASEP